MARLPAETEDMTPEQEAELTATTEAGEWKSVDNVDEWKAWLGAAARNTLNPKRKRISIAVPERDLVKLKARASEEGIAYQTLINSLIHKYVEGRLKD
ncbi:MULTISPECIES: CopG family antitoxin [unclassified Roseitalea]|uniref:CopG family antitoxin n=1 Tax=unclassified Roseitalea TaxID=2639107 RepID=UPI00273FDAD9|nr:MULTISPECIES: CopG family antitoxin [unclassified Roseitalea]